MKHNFSATIIMLSVALLGMGNRTIHKHSDQRLNMSGYVDKGDSIEFIFGDQKTIKIGSIEFLLDNRRNDIRQVNLAGEFNNWSSNSIAYRMYKADKKLYKLVISKKKLGKKGDTRQFKFVLNEKYWIEPPDDAKNKITGKDGYMNLYFKL